MKNNKGFVISAILYPLLVLFLALTMGVLAMSDTRKRILDKMKLEISDSIFDDAECSCDTILNKLNYIIKNGVGGGGGGSYSHNVLGLNVKGYETEDDIPNVGNSIGDIAVITDVEVTSYYVSHSAPKEPKEGNIWIVQDNTSVYYIKSDFSNIGISYVMQYIEGKWTLKKAYVFDDAKWKLLYYVSLKGDGSVDLTNTDINAEITKTYGYNGQYQKFQAVFSGYYQIELWGASGDDSFGGKGAYTKGQIYLDAGTKLYIYVGGQGGSPSSETGGWNGGGNGYNGSNYTGRGGGGATDVRLETTTTPTTWNEFNSLKSRIMVAAGGGGGETGTSNRGGAGGSLSGGAGTSNYGGDYYSTGGTQSSIGYSKYNIDGVRGGFGSGGASQRTYHSSGGGGGGYYGGGGSGYHYTGGGGGSSYISGHIGCSSIDEESISTNIIHTGSPYHYSGYYFIQTNMLDGNSTMPSRDGKSTTVGSSGNGYAKISLVTVEVIEKKDRETLAKDSLTEWNYMYAGPAAYMGSYQVFTAPKSGNYQVELWGASGDNSFGGKGAYTSGQIYLNKNTKLYVYIGGQGGISSFNSESGGWNGGGLGYNGSRYTGYGGGGATDIRLLKTSTLSSWNEFNSLKSRIMVAGGGGGGETGTSNRGGAGGTLNGENGTSNYGWEYQVIGAFQAAGGYSRNGITSYTGTFGTGGASQRTFYSSGAGGGGYYGGGGSTYHHTGGSGGSSYISGYAECNSIDESSTASNIIHTGSAYHYSGYYFTNGKMLSGISSSMPVYKGGSTMTGNSGNGYAKITLVSEASKTDLEISEQAKNNLKKWYYSYAGTNLQVGSYQVFKADKTGNYQVELWGASGDDSFGGKGAYTKGTIYLNVGTTLYVYVGTQGGVSSSSTEAAGWNGGGLGYNGSSYTGRGGGGATDIRVVPGSTLKTWADAASLRSRIMVAGGGGGGESGTSNKGGGGGGLTGLDGISNYGTGYYAHGGTQVKGGYAEDNKTGTTGSFGVGGASQRTYYSSGGGGGGWYGGAGSAYHHTGGGGGSSYISGHPGCIGIDSSGSPLVQTYSAIANTYSPTGYKFTNTQMIDGEGRVWTTSRQTTIAGQPNNSGSATQSGQSGNGYATITFLGA